MKCNIGEYNIDCVIQNQSFSAILTWNVNGQPLDLTIYQFIFWDIFEYSNTIISKKLGTGISISGENNNVLSINLEDADTIKMRLSNCNHELRFVDFDGNNSYVIKGNIKVKQTKSRNGH